MISTSPRSKGVSPSRPSCSRRTSMVIGNFSALASGPSHVAAVSCEPSVTRIVNAPPRMACTRKRIGNRRATVSRPYDCSNLRRTAGSSVFHTIAPLAIACRFTSPRPKAISTSSRFAIAPETTRAFGTAAKRTGFTANTRPPCSSCSGWPSSNTTPSPGFRSPVSSMRTPSFVVPTTVPIRSPRLLGNRACTNF